MILSILSGLVTGKPPVMEVMSPGGLLHFWPIPNGINYDFR